MSDSAQRPRLTRRGLLLRAGGVLGVAAVGTAGYELAPDSVKRRLGVGPKPYIPDDPEGRVTLERVHSERRNRDVDLFTAVPAGHGDGAGLPVVVILHGGSATAADYQAFGFGRFLTAAVRAGAAPFVLAGADGGLLRWEPDGNGDDPQAMVADELPGWLSERGFDADRRALWGWSMGGYGALRLAEVYPAWARAVAAFSPAVGEGDRVFADADQLADVPLGVWCGTEDMFYSDVRALVGHLPAEPEVVSFSAGRHTRFFWNDHTVDAFALLSRHLHA